MKTRKGREIRESMGFAYANVCRDLATERAKCAAILAELDVVREYGPMTLHEYITLRQLNESLVDKNRSINHENMSLLNRLAAAEKKEALLQEKLKRKAKRKKASKRRASQV